MNDAAEVKTKLDIVDVIGESVQLKKAGRNFKGLCPFHGEKTPSFMVSPERQAYHCFGCGEGGDVFEYVMKREGVDFPEALQMLARRAGVELKNQKPGDSKKKRRLFEATEQAAKFFQAALKHSAGVEGRDYLTERGITPETAEAFGIGYAPNDYDTLINALKKKGFTDKELIEAGVASEGRRGPYARFRGRLMIPINDTTGVTRGFTGRILDPNSKQAKYVNTPETPLYHKGRLIFALDLAKDEIIKREYAVLVEGQMDVITAHQAGTAHVVATSGTAMTEEQLRQLSRFSKTIALALDTDSAGQAAMLRIVELVGDRDIELKVVDLGEAKDPDDLIQNKPNLWEKKLAMAEPVIDHVFRKELEQKQKPYTREAIADVLDAVLPVLKYRPALDQDFYAEQFAATLGLEKSSVLDRLKKLSGNKAAPKTPEAHQKLHKTPEDLVSERLIGLVLTTPDLKPKLDEVDVRIFPEPYQKAAEAAKSTYTDNSDRALESLLNTCSMAAAEYEPMAATDRATEFDRLYARLKLLWIKQHQPKLLAAIKRAEVTGDKDRRNQLMEEYVTLTRRIANG